MDWEPPVPRERKNWDNTNVRLNEIVDRAGGLLSQAEGLNGLLPEQLAGGPRSRRAAGSTSDGFIGLVKSFFSK